MNARGSTEVIVATIGLTMGALTQNLYTMIVTMAVITTMAMPPMLRWALRRLPVSEEEKARLEKEEIDAKGFVSQLRTPADRRRRKSQAANLPRGLPGSSRASAACPSPCCRSTEKAASEGAEPTTPLKEIATESAKGGHRSAEKDKEAKSEQRRVEVSARSEKKIDEAVQKEGAKGYDLLFVGIEQMHRPTARFPQPSSRAAKGFEGAMALAMAGEHPKDL